MSSNASNSKLPRAPRPASTSQNIGSEPAKPAANTVTLERERSSVKTYRPPDGSSPPVLCIHTTPRLMKKLAEFLRHFDKPPQQLFLEFVFVEMNEDDVAQFRYKLNHPLLEAIYGPTLDEQAGAFRTSPLDEEQNITRSNFGGVSAQTRRLRNLPDSLIPRL